jgi:hypothetical protein
LKLWEPNGDRVLAQFGVRILVPPHTFAAVAPRLQRLFFFGTKLEHRRGRCYMWITEGSLRWRDQRAYRVGFKVVGAGA